MTDNVVSAGDTFPVKLHKLLQAAELQGKTDIITWLPDGLRFKVIDKTRFASEIMPHYFASSTYKSFQRSKNLWGFQTVSKGVCKGECSHPLFVRGNIDLCRRMVRTRKDENGETESLDQSSPTGASMNSNSGQSGTNGVAQSGGSSSLLNQALLGNLSSGLNPSLFLLQQQQQQLGSLLSAAGLANRQNSNPLLSVLSSLNGGSGGNAGLLAALQGNAPAPSTAQSQSLQSLLLQLAPQQQQAPASSLNSQLAALLAQQNGGAGHGPGAPPLSSVGGPPLDAIETHTKKKNKNKHGRKSKSMNAEVLATQEKTNGLREAALSRGSRVVACRARGMSMDHNMHTAFFEIPQNPDHGMELVCSFATCRNGGIKFLWCKYCDDVIAKRTFKASHLHKDLVNAEEENGAGTDISDDSKNNKVSSSSSGEMPPKKRHKLEAVGEALNGTGKKVHEIRTERSTSSSSSSGNTVELSGEDGKHLAEMRAQWDALLDERQEMDSKDGISNWLDRVVETSEKFQRASRRARRKAKA